MHRVTFSTGSKAELTRVLMGSTQGCQFVRTALLLALVGALPMAWATPNCTGSLCQDGHTYKGGPGDCYGSSTTYAEARDNSTRYDDGTLHGGAVAGESCYARGQPASEYGRTIIVAGDAGAQGLLVHASFAWSHNKTASGDRCAMTVVSAGPTGATILPLPCATDPPWIYRPSPLLP